jgi:hypothetical protein
LPLEENLLGSPIDNWEQQFTYRPRPLR